MYRLTRAVLHLLFQIAAPLAASGQESRLAIRPLGSAVSIAELATPSGAVLGPYGRLYLWDSQSQSVLALDRQLRVVGRFGRKGSGPGEFREVTMVAALDATRLVVLDRVLRRLTVVAFPSPGASPVFEESVPLGFSGEAMCVWAPDSLIVQGFTAGHSVHLLSLDGVILRSYKKAAAEQSRMAAEMFSRGDVICDKRGGVFVVATRQLPLVEAYEVEAGTLLWARTLMPFRQMSIEDNEGSLTISAGRDGNSAVVSLGGMRDRVVAQSTFESRMDRAADTTMTFTIVLPGDQVLSQVDLPLLRWISPDLVLLVREDADVTLQLASIGFPTTVRQGASPSKGR